MILEFDGPAAWIFDLIFLGKSWGGVAEMIKHRRDLRLKPAQRKRLLYKGRL
ncbi:MAG: hypothetical protein J7J19_02455 [Thaumarchaeota archaeon]|nr:hypothetical protein [Nitrososphaerota archaeon]